MRSTFALFVCGGGVPVIICWVIVIFIVLVAARVSANCCIIVGFVFVGVRDGIVGIGVIGGGVGVVFVTS